MGGDRAQRMALAFVNPSNCFSRAHAVAKKTGETVKKACRCNRKAQTSSSVWAFNGTEVDKNYCLLA